MKALGDKPKSTREYLGLIADDASDRVEKDGSLDTASDENQKETLEQRFSIATEF